MTGKGTDAAEELKRGGLIALSALRAGRVAPGESVLVTAAASGTGHQAVQLAKALGAARVAAAAGSASHDRLALLSVVGGQLLEAQRLLTDLRACPA